MRHHKPIGAVNTHVRHQYLKLYTKICNSSSFSHNRLTRI